MELNQKLYEEILEIIKTKKNVELRHDVDVSLVDAHYMAYLESLYDVKAFYYIRFDCDYYNPYSKANTKRIELIESYGHTIGLHIEVKEEQDLCNGLLSSFEYFTFHINNEFTKKLKEEKYCGSINKSLIKGGYVSDSRGEFIQENLDYIKNNDNFTLCIHPEWWLNSGTKEEKIVNSLANYKEQVLKEILP